MSSRKQVITAGILAVAIALATIAGATLFLPSTSPSTSTSTSATSLSSTSSQTSSSLSSSTQAETSQVTGGTGNLSILLTDPPTIPDGVTGIYVTYSNVAVHVSGAGNKSGWTESNTSGSLDLMKLVNVSTTIATVKVSSGVYNALRFNISSAAVTFNAKNYTAFVPRAMLTVAIPGGIKVNAVSGNATIVDMHPTVVNIGSRSNPEFVVSTAASAYGLPRTAVTRQLEKIGFTMKLDKLSWWKQINEQYTSNIQITSTTLSNDSLSVTVKNTGTQDVNLSALSVTPIGNLCITSAPSQGSHSEMQMPLCFTGSAFFIVQDNGTLTPLSTLLPVHMNPYSGSKSHQLGIFANQGDQLAPGQSVTLTYSNSITFGFAMGGRQAPGPVSGDQYAVTVAGRQALAQTIVVAT